MRTAWKLIASIVQLVVGIAAIISYIIIAISGEPMLKWTVTLILAIGFVIVGIIGIVDWIRAKNNKRDIANK